METKLSLTHDGIEMINYPETVKQNVIAAAEKWEQFLTLGDDKKQAFDAATLQSGTGYEKKGSGERESRDIKENFDITAESLAELASKAFLDPKAYDFITAASELFSDIEQMIINYGQYIQETYNVDGFAQEAAASAHAAFVRFLYYPPVPAGTIIGEPHVDHSGFTFHLYESTDGCERLHFDDGSWRTMPVAPHQTATFASMQAQLFSYNVLRGLCHRIIANETTSRIGRIAIVCFVPLATMPPYDRARHGRLQEMKPGFNYNMPYNDFANYFRSVR